MWLWPLSVPAKTTVLLVLTLIVPLVVVTVFQKVVVFPPVTLMRLKLATDPKTSVLPAPLKTTEPLLENPSAAASVASAGDHACAAVGQVPAKTQCVRR